MDYKKAKLAHNHLTEELADKIKAAGYDDLLLMTAGPYKGNSCLSAYCVNAQMMADAAGMICWNDDDKVRYFSLISVSYTHLDVYKRQLWSDGLP